MFCVPGKETPGDVAPITGCGCPTEPFSLADVATMLRLLGSGGTPLHRFRVGLDFAISGRKQVDGMIARHAMLARALGEQLGLSAAVLDALGCSYERWDGKGYPGNLAAADIPMAARIVQLAEFVEVAHRTGPAIDIAERRSGKQFDPSLVAIFTANITRAHRRRM